MKQYRNPGFPYFLDLVYGPTLGLPEEAWRKIERAAGIKEPLPLLRAKIAEHMRRHYSGPAEANGIRPRHLRAALLKVARRAKDLADLLDIENIPLSLESLQDWAALESVVGLQFVDRLTLVTTLRHLETQLSERARRLAADEGGPTVDRAFQNLIPALANLYEDFAGELPGVSLSPSGRYGGPFFRFVDAISRHLPEERRKPTNSGLGKALQRALKERRHIRGMRHTT